MTDLSNNSTKEALRLSEARLKRAEIASKSGNWELHLDTTMMIASEGAALIYGVDTTSLTYEFIKSVPLPEYRQLLNDAIKSLLVNGVPYDVEFKIKTPATGEIKDIHSLAIYDKDSNTLFGVIQDISQRKHSEEALRKSEEKYRSLLECAPDAFFQGDPQGDYITVNNQASILTGYSREELLSMNMRDIFDKDAIAQQPLRYDLLSSQAPIKKARSITTKSRKKIPVEMLSKIMPDGTGQCFMRDISQRIDDAHEREMLNEQIHQMQKLDSLGVLAGGIAHDFNNLLGGIYGFLELARLESDSPQVKEYLDSCYATISRTRALTQQLLTFAKGGTPCQKIEKLFPFVEETVQFALSGSNVSCSYDIQDDLWDCSIDKIQIGQVVDNIIINAKQAMPEGGDIRLCASNISLDHTHLTLMPGTYVSILVKDEGIGISPEILPRIFDPFFTTKPSGHGLGLATCYSIIHRHGGSIDVESEEGTGTVFQILLPAVNGSQQEAQKDIPAKNAKESGIFIVMDDETTIRTTLCAMLKFLGYTALCTTQGNETLELFAKEKKQNNPVKGIILDLTIPGNMGGKETAEALRNLDPQVPIFVMSGYSADPIIANPTKYGFASSICKPFTLSDLSLMIENHG